MRKVVLLAFIAALALTARAARRTSVVQLEEFLSAATAEHRADADIAHQIGGWEMSERLTQATLDRLAAHLALQPRTALALQLLADQSAFLDPPPAELPATAPPDPEEQRRMLESARGYVVSTLPRLPNFFANRTTHRYDDSPQVVKQGDWPVRAGLHPVGTSNRTVTFRDGKEVADANPPKSTPAQELGLHTWGEFGPELSVILTDLVNGSATFHHWERLATGLAAVYRYSVPAAASHYAVHYCCTFSGPGARTIYNARGRTASTSNYSSEPAARDAVPFNVTPGYHGEISIDPATGAVMRITLEAELKPDNPISRAATVVEYGPVPIGDRTFVCPTRSLAISVEEAGSATVANAVATNNGAWPTLKVGGTREPLLLVNETAFTDYHRLGSSARIVADAAPPADSGAAPPGTAAPAEAMTAETTPPVPAPELAPSAGSSTAPAPPAAPPVSAAPAPAPEQPVVPEISMSAAGNIPDIPTGAARAGDTGYSLKITTRLVDIGLVATDKKGRPVTDLKPEDFEIYDGKSKREVRFFSAPPAASQAAQSASAPAPAEHPERDYSNRAPEVPAAPAPQTNEAAGGTVLLVDESHIAWPDMQNARNHMLKFLDTLPAGERVGLYTMNGLGFRVLVEVTGDHGALIAGLKRFMPTAQSLQQAQEEETRNRQSFDYVHNVADLNSVNGNHADVADAEQPVDPQLLTLGSNPARASLIILAQVARHLATIPGHKNLVWVSSDNVLADWQDQQVGIDKSPKSTESFALRAQEVMNEAHAAVYPFDVSQLEAGGVGADLQHANVQLAPAQQENASTAASAGGGGGGMGSGRDTGTGRITAQMSQDLHPIQGTVRDLASATGGRPIRRSGDLAAQLSTIVEDGHATYQLSFSPEGPADDQYHKLTVRLVGHRGVNLRYRAGYLYAKEPATLKDRFRDAVWRPTDTTEIGVDAKVAPSGSGVSVKLNIAAGDLGMEQAGGRWMDRLDIFFIQRDDAGIHAQLEGETLGLRLKPSTYQNVLSAGVPFERAVEMRPNLSSLRILVVDENSGRMGSITLPAQELLRTPMQAKSF
ncbi:VWA domain-containing protein [Acidobacteria bacterium AB60]|nr:VWA domain-containing protein [Acidobacteria bacterium AB60]